MIKNLLAMVIEMDNFEMLNDIFAKKLKKIKIADRKFFQIYMPEIYNKWLYSTIRKDVMITPANIFMAIDKNIFPVVKNFSEKNIDVEPLHYSLDNHPIVNDLRIIVENFVPIYDLIAGFDINDGDVKRILHMLSMYDVNYFEYLKIMCAKLGLFKIMPSINCQKLWIEDDAHKFFENDASDIFDTIFDANVEIFFDSLCAFFSAENNFDGYDFVIDLFYMYNNPMSRIMNEILHFFNVEEKSFLADQFKDFLYFLNITLNRFFFVPFGNYLKLIVPVNTNSFDIETLYNLLKSCIEKEKDVYRVFDFSNTYFNLTKLGENYFKSETTDLFGKISDNEIDYLINNFDVLDEKKYPNRDTLISFKFRIEIDESPQYWKVFECCGQMNLHEFFLIIAREFNLDIKANYSFVKDENYIKDDKITLNNLNLKDNDAFYLILHNQINYYALNNSKLIENHIKLKINVYKSEASLKNIFFNYKLYQQSPRFAKLNFTGKNNS